MSDLIKPDEIFHNKEINALIETADASLHEMGFTEHGFAHAKRSSNYARDILASLDFPERTCELAAIAGYIHDIGNAMNRCDHAHTGAALAFSILRSLDMPPDEVAQICSAIGYHDEKTAYPVNPLAAALILSDKSDVRRTRVRKDAVLALDIHDRVNYAVESTSLKIDKDTSSCIFNVVIDTAICPVMEYFEIFLERMVLCRKAAQHLGLVFELIINNTKIL